jgi:hypothetical protein
MMFRSLEYLNYIDAGRIIDIPPELPVPCNIGEGVLLL